ncbi:MAG: hypothetical protein PHT16_02100 [Candidatus Pacebacteria bacterium]|nr:hypothetical protein [Candidatus Paceibacterota bacterium]
MILLEKPDLILALYKGEHTLDSLGKLILTREGRDVSEKIIIKGGLLYNDNDEAAKVTQTLAEKFKGYSCRFIGNVSMYDVVVAYQI